MPLDTLVYSETPEGLQLAIRPAGLTARAYAFIIDWSIRGFALSVVAALLGRIGGFGTGLLLILYFLMEWFYPVAFELSASGATPGKRLLHLQVMMDSGLPITPAASIIRNLLRVADFAPFAFGFGIVSMLCRTDFKRLGDLAAGTLVVYRSAAPAPVTLPQAVPAQPAAAIDADAQTAIISLAARASRLTPERVDELVTLIPANLLPATATQTRTQRMFALARWLLGHRATS